MVDSFSQTLVVENTMHCVYGSERKCPIICQAMRSIEVDASLELCVRLGDS